MGNRTVKIRHGRGTGSGTLPKGQRLSKELLDALRLVRNGADITSYSLAKTLRAVSLHRPELIQITKLRGQYNSLGVMPYFGAILTAKGKKLVDRG